MNERIKELADKAGYDVKPFYKGEDGYQTPHYKDEKLEKFAELIVRETLRVTGATTSQHQTALRCFGVEL